ncbi:MAG: hypothetical protein ACRCUT_08745, partial [Spirochaetota bacterium]
FRSGDDTPAGIPRGFTHETKGGNNTLTVAIESSENAQSYDIRITDVSNTPTAGYSKLVNIGWEALSDSGNLVFIDRNTLCADGSAIGFIPAGSYFVKAAAKGVAYGSSVTTQSSSNSTTNVITVTAPKNAPYGFSITANGSHNRMQICVDYSQYAEYFTAEIEGPLNSNYSSMKRIITPNLHSGYNNLTIDTPAADDATEPGIYRISVTAQNSVSLASGASAAVSETTISIPYDRYSAQKDPDTRPQISAALEKLGAVDLEVNFNDGNGWYTLQTSGVDGDLDGRKAIDCRYTSNVNYSKQTFSVYFAPPAGSSGLYTSIYNIFAGEREVADVYIRTIPKNQYRDTLWPRKVTGKVLSSAFLDENSSVSNALTGYDLVKKIISGGIFDATNVENTSSYTGETETFSGGSGDLPLIYDGNGSVKKENLFFSPLKERDYTICASLTDQAISDSLTSPDAPLSVIAVPGFESICVKNIEAWDHTEKLRVYYKSGADLADNEDILHSWVYAGEAATDSINHGAWGNFVLIPNLQKNRPCRVAVYGYKSSTSGGVYSTPWISNVIIPWSSVPSSVPSFGASSQADKAGNVMVTSLYAGDAVRYRIYVQELDGNNGVISTVLKKDTYDGTPETVLIDPVNVLIPGLKPWTKYNIIVRAASLSPELQEGPASQPVCVMTLFDTTTAFNLTTCPIGGISSIRTMHKFGYHTEYYILASVLSFTTQITSPAGAGSYDVEVFISSVLNEPHFWYDGKDTDLTLEASLENPAVMILSGKMSCNGISAAVFGY